MGHGYLCLYIFLNLFYAAYAGATNANQPLQQKKRKKGTDQYEKAFTGLFFRPMKGKSNRKRKSNRKERQKQYRKSKSK